MSLKWNKSWFWAGVQGCLILLLVFLTIDTLHPVSHDISYSRVLLDEKDRFVHSYLSDDDKWRLYTEVDEITDDWIRAILVKEDRFFRFHPGFNPFSMVRAAINNSVKGYRTSGASTITMQTIRLLEPRPRTIASKLTEVFRAMQLEWHLSKKEILQLYVNLLPYGGNIEGIKSASLIYLDKFPQQLSLEEIAVLAVIPNDPERFKFGADAAALTARRNALLDYFRKKGTFNVERIDDAKRSSVTGYRRQFNRKAPHFSRMMRSHPGPPNLMTTLDLQIQSETESLVRSYSNQLRYSSIYNLSVLVIDNEEKSIKAWVGSHDFYDNEHSGQVDGITALRSPGSTLKPFIYGLAFDRGLMTPKSVMTDLPVNYQGYQPENYDESYRGNVTAEFALAHSLNVPAVKTLDRLGLDVFTEMLSEAGFRWIEQNRRDLGLSLALGGCGVSLLELTGLYTALANEGKWTPLNYVPGVPVHESHPLLSEASAYMLHSILSGIKRPDLPHESENARNLPRIAWKTGTSYGRRDAWSIGYNKNYTVGVWTGNFTGEGVPELTGSEIATPLMLRIFNSLEANGQEDSYRLPEGLHLRYVCKESGNVVNEFCESEILDHYIPEVSPSEPCGHLQEIWTDAQSTHAYCSYCMDDTEIVRQWFPNLPGDLIAWYESENIPYKKVPPHHPRCDHFFKGEPPVIMHPTHGSVYYQDSTKSNGILLKAHASNDVALIHWYLNDAYYGVSPRDESRFARLPHGRSTITCTDDKGRSSTVVIDVEHY